MSFEEFQYGRRGGHFGYQNGTIFAILNLCVTVMTPIKFRLNRTYGLGGDVVWGNSRWLLWRLSWISERTILAILNLYVAPMSPIKFRLNLTYSFGDVVWTISIWPSWRPSWISERNDFSNSESLWNCDAFHQSDLRFGSRCRLNNFKMAAMVAILDIGKERF